MLTELKEKVAILIISDTRFTGENKDTVTTIIERMIIEKYPNYIDKIYKSIVPDEKVYIQSKIMELVQNGIEIILTSGGTGFGVRDITPEVILYSIRI